MSSLENQQPGERKPSLRDVPDLMRAAERDRDPRHLDGLEAVLEQARKKFSSETVLKQIEKLQGKLTKLLRSLEHSHAASESIHAERITPSDRDTDEYPPVSVGRQAAETAIEKAEKLVQEKGITPAVVESLSDCFQIVEKYLAQLRDPSEGDKLRERKKALEDLFRKSDTWMN